MALHHLGAGYFEPLGLKVSGTRSQVPGPKSQATGRRSQVSGLIENLTTSEKRLPFGPGQGHGFGLPGAAGCRLWSLLGHGFPVHRAPAG